jgi:hypothetical protein
MDWAEVNPGNEKGNISPGTEFVLVCCVTARGGFGRRAECGVNLAKRFRNLLANAAIDYATEFVEQLAGGFGCACLNSAAGRSQKNAACAAVLGVDGPTNQAATFKQRQDGGYRVGVGGGFLDERNLSQAFILSDDREGHELVGGDSQLEHAGIRAAVKAQISLAKEHAEFVAGVHGKM